MEYNYLQELTADILAWIHEHVDKKRYKTRADLERYLRATLPDEDDITGRQAGSYTLNSWTAEENLCHNWTLLQEAMCWHKGPEDPIAEGPEWCDMMIRLYLLDTAISQAVDDIWRD